MQYQLTDSEKEKLVKTVNAVLSIPFIDDIEDFIWEAVFCHVKNLPLTDPLVNIRSKRLFDIVDIDHKIGWSAKAVQWATKLPGSMELVIQRADIFKKASTLGFPPLSVSSDPQMLGKALMRHWIDEKVTKDADHQAVVDKRVCILVKSQKRDKFIYLEEDLVEYAVSDLAWKWTDDTNTGLQGLRKSDGKLVYRWYPNQKQLFERLELPSDSFTFELKPERVPMNDVTDLLLAHSNKL